MKQRIRRAILAAGAAACFSPAVTNAFDAVDEILWPYRGTFPAYPAEPPDGKTVHFSAFTGLMHDDNLVRLSDSTDAQTVLGTSARSDNIWRYGASLDANIPISRQNILVNARIEQRDYNRFDALDHTAYKVGAGWNWTVGNDWSGDVGYLRDHYLSSLADIQRQVKDMIDLDNFYANVGYRIDARWRVRGGLDFRRYDHSDSSQTALDNRTSSFVVGADYLTPSNNSIGAQFRYTKGNYPNQQAVAVGAGSVPVDNEYKEYETSAVARWIVTGKSTFTGRAGYTKREHEQVSQRDFSGFTGRLGYDWFVANKTLLNFQLYREIGSYVDTQASYVVNQGGSFGPAWAPTEKLIFQGRLVYEKRDYKGDPGFVASGTSREDTFRGLRLSGGWAPRRNVEIVISADYGDRSSNVVGRDYDFTSVLANARLLF